ncbi:MAG: hypothetical protein EXQ74_05970 [Thermoleophilia bacterium]|nr:hypothetical protein [Thermoleophilia bacterium]
MHLRTTLAVATVLALPTGLLAQAQPSAPVVGTTPTTPAKPAPATPRDVTPIMGQSRLSGDQIAAWFARQGVAPAITISILDLARIFVDEGNAQNVRGDLAFAQSIIETGWFTYAGSMVRRGDNNYSGLGACDTCNRGNIFATPNEGARAQIQHLWAYADPTASVLRVARPLTDKRFTAVHPVGKAPAWEDMGNGNWASDTGYPAKILAHYASMLRFNGLQPELSTGAEPSDTPTGPLPVLVTRSGGVRLGTLTGASGTLANATAAFGSEGRTRAAYGTCHVTWATLGAVMTFAPGTSGTCADDARLRSAVLTGNHWVTGTGVRPGASVATLRKAYRLRPTPKITTGTLPLVTGARGARLTARVGEGVVKALIVRVPAHPS